MISPARLGRERARERSRRADEQQNQRRQRDDERQQEPEAARSGQARAQSARIISAAVAGAEALSCR